MGSTQLSRDNNERIDELENKQDIMDKSISSVMKVILEDLEKLNNKIIGVEKTLQILIKKLS